MLPSLSCCSSPLVHYTPTTLAQICHGLPHSRAQCMLFPLLRSLSSDYASPGPPLGLSLDATLSESRLTRAPGTPLPTSPVVFSLRPTISLHDAQHNVQIQIYPNDLFVVFFVSPYYGLHTLYFRQLAKCLVFCVCLCFLLCFY